MARKKAGQPPKVTAAKLQELKSAFMWGCTDAEACCYADISTSTLYNYCKDNPSFLELKNTLKNNPAMKARRIINEALDDGDLSTAQRVIDRKDGSKVNLNAEIGIAKPKTLDDFYKEFEQDEAQPEP